jgi:acetaldehyde dehydrogenase
MIKVQGLGDYLPKYAGNMDIINCAAVEMAEQYAKARNSRHASEIMPLATPIVEGR